MKSTDGNYLGSFRVCNYSWNFIMLAREGRSVDGRDGTRRGGSWDGPVRAVIRVTVVRCWTSRKRDSFPSTPVDALPRNAYHGFTPPFSEWIATQLPNSQSRRPTREDPEHEPIHGFRRDRDLEAISSDFGAILDTLWNIFEKRLLCR
jgi:hypothetical protein